MLPRRLAYQPVHVIPRLPCIQAGYEFVEFTQAARSEGIPMSYLTNPWNLLDWSRFAILATGVIFRVRMTYDTSRDFDLSTK